MLTAVFLTCLCADPILADLSFIRGHWRNEQQGSMQEEWWTDDRGNIMLGISRIAKPGKSAFFEYLRIELKQGKIYYVASPKGGQPVSFALIELTGKRVVFENKQHDFPQRIIYERVGDQVLSARIEGEIDGQIKSSSWQWHKVGTL